MFFFFESGTARTTERRDLGRQREFVKMGIFLKQTVQSPPGTLRRSGLAHNGC